MRQNILSLVWKHWRTLLKSLTWHTEHLGLKCFNFGLIIFDIFHCIGWHCKCSMHLSSLSRQFFQAHTRISISWENKSLPKFAVLHFANATERLLACAETTLSFRIALDTLLNTRKRMLTVRPRWQRLWLGFHKFQNTIVFQFWDFLCINFNFIDFGWHSTCTPLVSDNLVGLVPMSVNRWAFDFDHLQPSVTASGCFE